MTARYHSSLSRGYKILILTLWLIVICLSICSKNDDIIGPNNLDYKQEMRNFVNGISQYAKSVDSDFIIIPQNGIELVQKNGVPYQEYLTAIDGSGQEDLYYGYDKDDQATSVNQTNYLKSFLNISKNAGNTILVTDYCSTHAKMDDSYSQNASVNYVSFAADHRELDNIPFYPDPINNVNSNVITSLSEAQNFLYLINYINFFTKTEFINAVTSTNYDLLIMDIFFHNGSEFTFDEIDQLRNKANGGKRLVISYMSIGEAENYRYYWQSSWNSDKPDWLDSENPEWEGNFKVKYWNKEWQNIIFGKNNSYLKKILNAGFDGVYLDIINAFEYYE